MSKESIQPKTSAANDDESLDHSLEIQKEKTSPMRRIVLIVLTLCVLIFIWHLLSNRHTPYSDQSRLNALVVPIVPKVSGYLKKVNVRLHSEVKENDTIFEIDKKPFKLAVKLAEANFEQATQEMGYQGAGVKSARGRLGMAKAQQDRAQRNYDRIQNVLKEDPDALSQYDSDEAETALSLAIQQVQSAYADLEKAQQALGKLGPENATLKSALTNLENAQLKLSYTSMKAPSDGIIESFNLDYGHYCSTGQPMATFISTHDVWIQADFKENSIENINVGDKVEFTLELAPGRIFEGEIRSIGYGVSSNQILNRGQLPDIKSKSNWLRDPQRFPVIVSFSNAEVMKYFKLGGQVDVVVYTGDHFVLNTLAKFRIWINSKLSYVR